MLVILRTSVGPPARPRSSLVLGIVLVASIVLPRSGHADPAVSCLVRPAEPGIEWALVVPAVEDSVSVGVAPAVVAAPPLAILAFDAWPEGVDRPGSSALAQPAPGMGVSSNVFVRAWLPITIGELSLLTITAMLPKDWTGWSADFVGEGAGNLAEAWTRPPVMDSDHWFHNYVGHPYGGSFYYNSVRTRDATPIQSMAFAAALSLQWEYVFEAVAERPSIQDIVITPIAGAALGELTHRMSRSMRKGRVTLPEKVLMTVLNPADVLAHGYKSSD